MPSPEEVRPGDVYWASKDGLDLAEAAFSRVKRYFTDLIKTTPYKRWSRGYRIYYGLAGQEDPFDISKVGVAGEEGELSRIRVNHAGSIARRSVSLVSSVIPEFDPVPENDDSTSLEQAMAVRRFLNYCMDTKGVGQFLYDVAEIAAIFGEGSLFIEWDPRAGPALQTPDPGNPARTKTGDLVFRVFTPLDLVIDRFRYDCDHDWTITRRFVNRWDLAARYPSLRDDILDLKPEPFPAMQVPTNSLEWEKTHGRGRDYTDLIPLFTLYHRKTDALPQGKYAEFLNANLFLCGSHLPYDEVPRVSIAPGRIKRTPYGDTLLHHILALQEVYDHLASSIASNNIATATQIYTAPRYADISAREIGQGAALFEYDPSPDGSGKPEAFVMTGNNGEAARFMKDLERSMETIHGISSTVRGVPGDNIKSGAFGALVAQQALEYASAFQYSFQQAIGSTGNIIVSILKQYADQPIVAEIVGDSGGYLVQSFTKDQFSYIRRVTVKSGNPATRTAAFNIAAADSLLAKGVIDNAKDYLTLVRTGNMDVMVDSAEANLLRMRRENEQLRKGINPPVLATDSHKEDIDHAASVLADPSVRGNPKVVQAVLGHIQAHIEQLRTVDPALLNLLGQTPLPPAMGMPGQPLPQGPAGPPGMPGEQPGPAPAPPPPPPSGQLPHQPKLPTNPLTGKTWTPHDGAIRPHQ